MDRETVIGHLGILRTWCAVNPAYGRGLDVEDCGRAVGWLDDAIGMMKAEEETTSSVSAGGAATFPRGEGSGEAQGAGVHGRWEDVEDIWGDTHYRCSVCNCEWFLEDGTPAENGMKYCPRCGAKMDGERRDGA